MRSFFNNLKLGKKMLLAPLVVFIFLLILGYFTFSGLFMQKDSIEEIYQNRFKGYQISAKLLMDLSQVQANLYRILNWVGAGHDEKEVADLSKKQADIMAADVEMIKKTLALKTLSAEEKKTFKSALENILEFQKATLKVLEMAPKWGASDFLPVAEEKYAVVVKLASDLLAFEEKLGKETYQDSIQSFNTTLGVFLGVFVVAIIMSFIISVYTTRMILKPVRKTIHVLKKLEQGDLTHSIDVNSHDEIGELVQSVNAMREKMGEAVGQALHVSAILSDAASQEAASIEETSASLDEIASMTRQNAANTSEANQLMISAKQAIQQANQSMVDLTRSMKEITGASEQTQKIVKSIDEIAFQTNLLALNAAVEAARAGEAGAGFAVVADEVRNLAMRATESARNSSNLIEDIVRKVKSGESLVDVTSSAFMQVTTSSEKVVELMGEVAAASQEQSQGIDQVNGAIASMNTTTQQNAGNAEKLSTIMSRFKTDNHGARLLDQPPAAGQHKRLVATPKVIKPDQVLPMGEDFK